jgi:hypothetical protein
VAERVLWIGRAGLVPSAGIESALTRAPHVRTRTTTEVLGSTFEIVDRVCSSAAEAEGTRIVCHLREAEIGGSRGVGVSCQLSFGLEATSWRFRRSPELSEERFGPGDGRNDSLANEERESLPSCFDGFAGLASLRQDP